MQEADPDAGAAVVGKKKSGSVSVVNPKAAAKKKTKSSQPLSADAIEVEVPTTTDFMVRLELMFEEIKGSIDLIRQGQDDMALKLEPHLVRVAQGPHAKDANANGQDNGSLVSPVFSTGPKVDAAHDDQSIGVEGRMSPTIFGSSKEMEEVAQEMREATNHTPATSPYARSDGLPEDWRWKVFMSFEYPGFSFLSACIATVVTVTIIVSTCAIVLETMPEFRERPSECAELLEKQLPLTVRACEPKPLFTFTVLEIICIAIFLVDYCARVGFVHATAGPGESRLKVTWCYARRPMCVVDILSILPFFFAWMFQEGTLAEVVGMLTILRVLRIFKIAKQFKPLAMVGVVLERAGQPLMILMFFNLILIMLFGSVLFFLEGRQYTVAPQFTDPGPDGTSLYPTGVYVRWDSSYTSKEVTPFLSIPYALWWTCVTLTTVGYGDMSPATWQGKVVATVAFYVGIIFLALPISVIGANFEEVFAEHMSANSKASLHNWQGLRETARRQLESRLEETHEPRCLPRSTKGFFHNLFLVLEDPQSCILAGWYSILMLTVIIFSTIAFVLETMPGFNYTSSDCQPPERLTVEDCEPRPDPVFWVMESLCIGVFTADYVLRVATVTTATAQEAGVHKPGEGEGDMTKMEILRGYCMHPLNLIDLFAILPFYLELAMGSQGGGMAVLRITRLVRVFRVLKFPSLRSCLNMFLSIMADSIRGLLLCVTLTCMVSILMSCCIYYAEGTRYSVAAFPGEYPEGTYIRPTKEGRDLEVSPFRCAVYSLWWFFVTSTTVGYGDDFATTTMGRLVSIITMYMGIVLVALPITIISRAFATHYPLWVEQVKAYAKGRKMSAQ